MPTEINDIFSTKAQSIWQFLIEDGQGCYIPVYQRPFSWDVSENIPRFFEDLIHGMKRLAHRQGSISFLGTIIAIHDTKYETIARSYQNHVPNKIMTIIDGQQRLCTAIILIIILHNQIGKLYKQVNDKSEELPSWIKYESQEVLSDLKKSYILDRTSGDKLYRYYPKVINAYKDIWARDKNIAKYESPIARLIWNYINYTESNLISDSEFDPSENEGDQNSSELVQRAYVYLYKNLSRFCRNPENYDFPIFDKIFNSNSNFNDLWVGQFPDEINKFVSQIPAHEYKDICCLLHLILFARYLTKQVAITIVTAKNVDDALDMFEALNTTGEPLTALETFKPKIIEKEGLTEYQGSESHKDFNKIDDYLGHYLNARKKQKVTDTILVAFALSETGKKLPEKFKEQRRYLRDEYEKLPTKTGRRNFVKSLANLTEFIHSGWNEKIVSPHKFPNLNLDQQHEEALVGFELLKGLGHTITIPPLYRFYEHAISGKHEQSKRTEDFILAIKATVAFSVLWRGYFGSPNNIDSIYRKVMHLGVEFEDNRIPPLTRRPEGQKVVQKDFSLKNYKKSLQLSLKKYGKISTKEDWVKNASKINIYKLPKVTRFLLMCASHDTIPSKSEMGLIEKGRRGISPQINLDQWFKYTDLTIEHIAPDKGEKWNGAIYEDSETIHCLGNLIILPSIVNDVLGNRKWEHKRGLYKLLASKSKAEFEQIKSELRNVGFNISLKIDDVFDRTGYQNMCQSIANYDDEWSLEIIEKRSKRYAELAWDILYLWLDD